MTSLTGAEHYSPTILECTVRDGNYAVNFQFTRNDTKLLTQKLAELGFKWIEIGHGLGLGASAAGKGHMPDSDSALICSAKEVSGDALIGMFFIPGVGTAKDIESAKDAGLDFIRIGCNASEIDKAYPFIVQARKLGLRSCVNFMKTYAITPAEFEQKSKAAFDVGAEVVYCVDSAGCMLPEQVSEFFETAAPLLSEFKESHFGFHGHNNLMLGIANCLQAIRSGAKFIDTTLYGLGRSAGNAPTEVLVAVLERMGIRTQIDLFQLMKVAEGSLWPLISQTRMHTMMSVAIGYGCFHSSFLPKVAAAAERYNADLRQLVVQMGQLNPNSVDDTVLENAAKSISNSRFSSISSNITDFQTAEMSDSHLRLTSNSVEDLVNGLVTATSKKPGSVSALLLTPSYSESGDMLLSEFVVGEKDAVIGKIIYGSTEALKTALDVAKGKISLFLFDEHGEKTRKSLDALREMLPENQIFPVSEREIQVQFVDTLLRKALSLTTQPNILIYGSNRISEDVISSLPKAAHLFVTEDPRNQGYGKLPGMTFLRPQDWSSIKLDFHYIICFERPSKEHATLLARSLNTSGKVFYFDYGRVATIGEPFLDDRMVFVDVRNAYIGIAAQLMSVSATLGDVQEERVPFE